MNHLNKAINMILRGDTDKFNNILHESLKQRAVDLLEKKYYEISSEVLLNAKPDITPQEPIKEETAIISPIRSVYSTKDGKTINLTTEEVQAVSKLYEKLNNNNQQRMLRLLSESEEAINRIINLAKIERTKHVK